MRTGLLASRFEAAARIAARVCIGLGILVMIGWHARIDLVVQLTSTFTPMYYDAALGFVLAGAGLLLALYGRRDWSMGCGFALVVIGIAGLTDAAMFHGCTVHALMTQWNLIDGPAVDDRMHIAVSICLTLAAAALISADWHRPFQQEPIILVLSGAMISGIGLIAFFSYVTDLQTAYGWGRLSRMAVHAATGFMVLGIGISTFGWAQREARELNISRLRNALITYSTMGTLITVLVAASLAVLPLYARLAETQQQRLSLIAEQQARLISQFPNRISNDVNSLGHLAACMQPIKDDVNLLLGTMRTGTCWAVSFGKDGQLRTQPAPTHLHSAIQSGAGGHIGLRVPLPQDSMPTLVAYHPLQGTDWVVLAIMDARDLEASLNAQLQWIIAGVLAIAMFSALGMYLLVRPLTGDMLVQTDTMEQRIAESTNALEKQIKEYRHLDAALSRQAGRLDRANAALKASEQRFRQLAENIREVFWITAPDGIELLYVSPAYDHVWQTPRTEKAEHALTFYQAAHPDDRERITNSFMTHAVAGEGTYDEQYRIIRPDGSVRWLRDRAFRVMDDEGNLARIVGIAEDVTVARETRQRIESDKAELDRLNTELGRSNTELEQFAYVASHDLQEPLRMVASYVQLLERRYKDKLDDTALEFIGFAVDGAKRMQTLINDLLHYSRVATRGEPFAATDLNEAVATAIANLEARIRDTQAKVQVQPLPTINGDKGQIARLMQNLIGNGLKFCDKDQSRIDVKAARSDNDDAWIISVSDNGIGIDPKYADRVFVIFQRLHTRAEYEGTGIGLAVCKRIVERHGGEIWFDSTPGEGTTFYFTLPDLHSSRAEEGGQSA